MKTANLLFALALLTTACATEMPAEMADRGPIGKADLVGSCEESCDGPSMDGNCWCDDLCELFGDCCEDKAAICESSFVSFATFRGGFCPFEMDCSASIELHADGTLIVDRMGEPQADPHVATVSAEDLADAILVLTSPELIELLDSTSPPCPQPIDIFESMTLEDNEGTHRTSTTFCNLDPISDVRKVLDALADKYLPIAGTFESFEIFRGGFCPPELDCTSRIELLADGTLRVDRMGEPEGPIHETTVTDVDLAAAVAVFTDPDLLALLDSGDQACNPPTDIFESMTITDDRGEHRAGITFCNFPELDAAKEAIDALVAKYLP